MSRSLVAALVSLSIIWGGSFFFIKALLPDFGPWTISLLRASFGLATIVVIMLVLRKPFGLRAIPWFSMTVMALISTSLPWGIIGLSETRLTSSMASVLNATTPLWTLLVGMLFFRTSTSRVQWVGMGVATIGLLILVGVNADTLVSIDGIGLAGMLAATLCYAVGSQLSKRLSRNLSMYQITFGTLLCAAVGSGITAAATEPIAWTRVAEPANLAMIVGLGVFGSGVAYILFYYMVQKGSPEFATTVTYLVPASAIVWGYLLLDEAIHWRLLTGLLFILAGVFLVSRKGAPKLQAGREKPTSALN